MKWNILVGSLVLSVVVCTQSYGFELMDRMLGVNHCGTCEPKCCEAPAAKCCTPKPKCCAPEPKCCPEPKCHGGLLDGLFKCNKCGGGCGEPKCCEEPKCYAPQPKCCAPEPKCCPEPKCHGGLLDGLFAGHKCGGCGGPKCCEADPCGKSRCGGLSLLDGLFGSHKCGGGGCGHKHGGCGGCGGCGGVSGDVEIIEETPGEAPMPPAPVVDESAFIPTTQHVVQASVR